MVEVKTPNALAGGSEAVYSNVCKVNIHFPSVTGHHSETKETHKNDLCEMMTYCGDPNSKGLYQCANIT